MFAQAGRISIGNAGSGGAILATDSYVAQHERMVREQIESRGVRDPDVLRVMRATPRHLFVREDLRSMAYEDCPLPIGFGASISEPYVVALMTALLKPAKKDRVLEIGTGSGYQAAVLAQLVSRVYTIEIVPELARSARQTLSQLGYSNVVVLEGSGYKGWPEQPPFDRIILTASPPQVPQILVDEPARGGRMVAPVGLPNQQELIVIERSPDGSLRRWSVAPVNFVPMTPSVIRLKRKGEQLCPESAFAFAQ